MSKIDKTHSLSVSRQCYLLDVPRSSFYYSPREDGSYNEKLMKQIDKQYMITPFYGVPRMTHYLRGIGYEVNPKRVRRLYRKMNLYATGPRPNTSKSYSNLCKPLLKHHSAPLKHGSRLFLQMQHTTFSAQQ
jgi:putative transposase